MENTRSLGEEELFCRFANSLMISSPQNVYILSEVMWKSHTWATFWGTVYDPVGGWTFCSAHSCYHALHLFLFTFACTNRRNFQYGQAVPITASACGLLQLFLKDEHLVRITIHSRLRQSGLFIQTFLWTKSKALHVAITIKAMNDRYTEKDIAQLPSLGGVVTVDFSYEGLTIPLHSSIFIPLHVIWPSNQH